MRVRADTKSLHERLWTRVQKTDTCWIWTGTLGEHGYGLIRLGGRYGRNWLVHRLVWTIFHGEIPDGLGILHTCDVPRCVNPDHLYPGTQKQNARDAIERGRLARGSRHGQAKLTETDVRQIRESRDSNRILSASFGVNESAIRAVRSGRNWGHVT